MIEYIPWYNPGASLVRCQSCGAMVVDGDTELHTDWHSRLTLALSQAALGVG